MKPLLNCFRNDFWIIVSFSCKGLFENTTTFIGEIKQRKKYREREIERDDIIIDKDNNKEWNEC